MTVPPWIDRVFPRLRDRWPGAEAGATPAAAPRVTIDGVGASPEGHDFTVGDGEPPLRIVIEGAAAGARIRTVVRVVEGVAPALDGRTFLGARFSLEARVDRRGMPGAGKDANPPVHLALQTEIVDPLDRESRVIETRVFQSARAVLLQEYVDARLNDTKGTAPPRPQWSDIVPAEGERSPPVGSPSHAVMIDQGVTSLLRALRAAHPSAFVVRSGYRNPRRNAAVGGRPDGAHPRGRAADVTVGESGATGAEARLALYRAAASLRVRGSSRALLEDYTRALAPVGMVPESIDGVYEERVRLASVTRDGEHVELVLTRERPTAERTATFSPVLSDSTFFSPRDQRSGSGRRIVALGGDDRATIASPRDEVIEKGEIWSMRTPWRSLLARSTHVHVDV